MFGAIGIFCEAKAKFFCVPLLITLQDGVKTFFQWQASEDEQAKRQESHVVQMIETAHIVAQAFGHISRKAKHPSEH